MFFHHIYIFIKSTVIIGEMDSHTFDITDITDVIVPIYSVIMFLFIIAYHKSPESKMEDRYFLKKVIRSTVKKDWRELITGYYHQSDSDGFDEWLKFLQKPYPIRLIAPKMFHKLHMDLKLSPTELTIQRFWNPEKENGETPVTVQLGTSRENAVPTKYQVAKAEDCGEWKGWVVEGEEKVQSLFTPTDLNSNPVLYFTREVIDEDTVLVGWEGNFRGNHCEMTSTYRRVG
jgi:hypothetical protein